MKNFNEHPLAGKQDIDSAFSGIWSFYKQWFKPLYIISFIMALLTAYISSKIDISTIQNTTDINEVMAFLRSVSGVIAIQFIISLFFNLLIQYFVIFKPLDDNFNLIDTIGTVFVRFYFPVLLISIVLGVFAFVAILMGALLLFIGIFFAIPYVMLFFTLLQPLMIIEKPGIGKVFTRLLKVVHKKFWSNMGWISVFLVLFIFFSFIVNLIVSLPFAGTMISSLTDPTAAAKSFELAKNPLYLLLNSLASAITVPFIPILGLVLYFNNSENSSSAGINGPDSEGDLKVEDLYSDRQKDDFSPSVEDLAPRN